MGEEIKDLLAILRAYGDVLANTSTAITYLLYTITGIIGGWSAGLLWIFIGRQNPVMTTLLMIAIFILLFTTSAMASSFILRIARVHSGRAVTEEAVVKRANLLMGIGWILSIIGSYIISIYIIPAEYSFAIIPTAVNLGVALGNLNIFIVLRYFMGRLDPRPFFLFLYLTLTIPTYFMPYPVVETPAEVVAFMLLTVHLGLSNFITAVWYIFSARRSVAGILHAARGQD